MAAPARKHSDIEPEIRPNLRAIDGGGESTSERGNLHAVDGSTDTAKDLSSQERRFGVIQGGGETTSDRGDLRSVSDNIDNTRESEQAGGGFTNKFTGNEKQPRSATLKNLMKKKGPIGVIAALLLGGGAGLGFFGLTLMPVTIMEQFTNDLNDLNASQQRKTINLFGNRIGGDAKKKEEACNNANSVRCKSFSFTEKFIEYAEEKGFQFGEKKATNGHVTVANMTFPDGTTVKNKTEFENLMRNSATANKAFNAVHSIRSGIFVVGDFFNKTLNKMGLTKRKKIEGKNSDDAKKSFEEATKSDKDKVSLNSRGTGNTDEDKKNAADGDDLSKLVNEKIAAGEKLQTLPVGRLGSGIAGVGRLACTAYNMAGMISALAKIRKALRFAGFALIFLTLASTIKANEATEAEVTQGMSTLAPAVYPEKVENPDKPGEMMDNPSIGMNALDADAYKVVAYGDQINLTGLALRFFIASGALGVLEKVLKWMDDTFTKQGIKTTCQILNNPLTGIISFLAAPAFSGLILALTELLPIDKIAAEIVNMAVDAIAGIDLTNDVIGKDAGEVLFIGAGMILGKASQGFGMPPGKLDKIRENVKANHQILEREIAMEKEEAAKTPFDIKNRYSFLGSLASQVATFTPAALAPGAGFTNSIGKVLSAFPTSLGMISKNAKAAFSMPVADYSNVRFDQCKDDAYQSIEMSPDMFCVVRYAPFEHVDMDAAITYMEENGMITPEGEPVAGKYLDLFKKHCVDREDPWGSTTVAVEEQTDPVDWYSGKMCMDNTVENQMASEYTGYRIIQQTVDRETTGQATTTTPISGDARALALQAANHPNIIWREVTKAQLIKFSKGEPVFNGCSAPMTVSKHLLGALLSNASKYRITVNNIGFKEDRNFCELGTYQHPKGTAVDISGIDALDGSGSTRGAVDLPSDAAIVTRYATDFLAALPRNRGGVGQSDFGVNPVFPPGSVALNGSHSFPDAGDHLHIDARNRENLLDTE